jgi:hypothetical protein
VRDRSHAVVATQPATGEELPKHMTYTYELELRQ